MIISISRVIAGVLKLTIEQLESDCFASYVELRSLLQVKKEEHSDYRVMNGAGDLYWVQHIV